MQVKNCLVCEDPFEYKRESKLYCSKKCRNRAEMDKLIEKRLHTQASVKKKRCEYCDAKFQPNKMTPDQPYCSAKCRVTVYRRDNREKINQWKRESNQRNKAHKNAHDSELHNQKRFGGLKYIVLERDKNKCVDCGEENLKQIIIHHKDFTKDNNIMENLETLCRSCHIKKHTHVLSRTNT